MLNLTVAQLIEKIADLKAGDQVQLSGTIYTARDAAHKRLADMIARKEALPFTLNNAVIYYCGPCPAKSGQAIGPCGPTTSGRMDAYTPLLLSYGVKASIGKGPRSSTVIEAMKQNKAVYLVATGGAATLLATKVKRAEIVGFKDLGPEAIYALEVVNFPLIVANDIHGNDIFKP